MLMPGSIDDGSSSVPSRTTRNSADADEEANRWQPQLAQEWREILSPPSASLAKQASSPDTSMAALRKMAFAVPFPEIFWHVVHQQIRATSGSPVTRYRTRPHRQLPVRCFIALRFLEVGSTDPGRRHASRTASSVGRRRQGSGMLNSISAAQAMRLDQDSSGGGCSAGSAPAAGSSA